MNEIDNSLRLPEALTDGVVLLDAYTVADAEAHWAGEDDEMVRRFEAPHKAPLEHVRGVIARWTLARAAGGPNIVYALRLPNGVLVGGSEVRWLGPGALNISYWSFPAFRGRRFVVRGVKLICAAAAVHVNGLERVEAHVDADNAGSRRVAEKSGFIEDGTVVDDAPDGTPVTRVRYVWRMR